MPRVFDCFVFSSELDLLEIRLHELAPAVDVFVIAESPVTFQGNSKPLVFHENRQRFAPFAERIRHIIIRDMPEGTRQSDHWLRQKHQRNALISGVDDATGDDVVLLSDVDEIPRATVVRAVAEKPDVRPTVHCFEQRMYQYFLDYQRSEPWLRSGPRAVRRRHLHTMQGLRYVRAPTPGLMRSSARWLYACAYMRHMIRRIVHEDAGWHFSSMGGVGELARKLRSNSAVVTERLEEPDRDFVDISAKRIENARHDTSLRKVPLDNSFPAYLLENRGRYRHGRPP